jgi:hypothetical protein
MQMIPQNGHDVNSTRVHLSERQGSGGAGERGSGGAGEQGSRGAGEQGSRGAGEQRGRGAGVIESHEELEVYKLAFQAAMRIFQVSRRFPREETYSLQISFNFPLQDGRKVPNYRPMALG